MEPDIPFYEIYKFGYNFFCFNYQPHAVNFEIYNK